MRHISRLMLSLTVITAVLLTVLSIPAAAQQSSDRIYVLGSVNNPGEYPFKAGMTVKDAIELAGGLLNNYEKASAILVRAKNDKTALNLQAILSGNETVILSAGDTILIKLASIRVEGQVKVSGEFNLKPGMTASDALTLAGGTTEDGAREATYVTRNGKKISANLDKLSSALPLEPDDIVTVPQYQASATGEVMQPGTYNLVQGKTDNLNALIQAAGGITPKADIKNVRISPLEGIDRPTRIVDASDASVRQKIKVECGDVAFIPQLQIRQKRKMSLGNATQITLMLYTLLQIFK